MNRRKHPKTPEQKEREKILARAKRLKGRDVDETLRRWGHPPRVFTRRKP